MATHQFTDSNGTTWTIEATLSAARRMRQAGHDIIDFDNAGENIPALYVDEIAMGEALYAICRPQAEARNLSEDDFLDALSGEVTSKARDALMGALPDFFSGPKKDVVTKLVGSFAPEMERQAAQAIASMESPGSESTNTSESSGSTAAA